MGLTIQAPAAGPESPEGQELLRRLRAEAATLTLAGDEVRALTAWVRAARVHFSTVAVAPGPAGFDEAALTGLMTAGIGRLHATLLAADAAAHDYHVGVAGSHAGTVAMLRAARRARLSVGVTTPLTRSNARVLAALPGLLVDVGAIGWRVVVAAESELPRPGDAGAMAPRLALALPYALQAIAGAMKAGLAAAITGAPLCLLGPLRGACLPAPPRAFASGCAECSGRGECAGVDPGYLGRYAGDELSPRALQPARAVPGVERIRDMFSGACLEVREGACAAI